MQVREEIRLEQFLPPHHPILVVCEKCGKCATLREFIFPAKPKSMITRLGNCSCLHCGHQWAAPAGSDFFIDGPLWLKLPCRKNVLCILNRQHLDFMEQFIAADLREERMPERSSRRLSSALPRWIISGKNREDVAHCLKKLRERLEDTTFLAAELKAGPLGFLHLQLSLYHLITNCYEGDCLHCPVVPRLPYRKALACPKQHFLPGNQY
jgi:hypothetical protein